MAFIGDLQRLEIRMFPVTRENTLRELYPEKQKKP